MQSAAGCCARRLCAGPDSAFPMPWYDEHSGTSPAEGQGYRQETTGLPRQARDDYYYEDEDCDNYFGTDSVGSDNNSKVEIGGSATSTRLDGDIDDGARLGVDGSHDWGSEETDVGRGDHMDAVVLRSLEEAISKYSATRQRPSTAVSDLVNCSTWYTTAVVLYVLECT